MSKVEYDIAVLGAGVAGLWTACRLAREGWRVVVLERSGAAGGEQTIASQGIIHGGIKYALTGEATSASAAISRMPGIWEACLQGHGEIDLSGVTVLSPCQYLWTTAGGLRGLMSKFAALAASKVIRTEVRRVERGEAIGVLRDVPKGIDVYCVQEPVLDAKSVAAVLLERARGLGVEVVCGCDLQHIHRGSNAELRLELRRAECGEEESVVGAVVCCAGEGNEELTRKFGEAAGKKSEIRMQVRPLHMVMAQRAPGVLYGHCLGVSATPRLTVTTFDVGGGGGKGWYIGGQIAEARSGGKCGGGVERNEEEQIEAAIGEVGACLPWIDLRGMEWATVRVDRAEGLTRDGTRPDEPVIEQVQGFAGRVMVCWPTKLAFAPELAERVSERLKISSVDRQARVNEGDVEKSGDGVRVRPAAWEGTGVKWRRGV